MISGYRFISRKLIETKEEISKTHKNLHKSQELNRNDMGGIERIVKIIDGLPMEQVQIYAYRLKKKEIHMLIQYMPENIYKVNLDKIYKVIDVRAREEFLLIFFRGFQNYYGNFEFNKYFIDYIDKYPEGYSQMAMNKNTLTVWKNWLKSEELVKIITNQYFRTDRKIDSYLNALGLVASRKLYKDCFRCFLTICRSKDYLGINPEQIIENLQTFDFKIMIKFMNNYLNKLNIDDFQDDVLEYIYISYDTPLNLLNQFIWENIDELAKDKYNLWYAKKKLFEFFRGDPRFEFWYRYIKTMEAKIIAINESQLFLDFKKFVVIEFKNIGNAAYVYKKEYFDDNYLRYLNTNQVYKESVFKNQKQAILRIIHGGEWQSKTSNLIGRIKSRDI